MLVLAQLLFVKIKKIANLEQSVLIIAFVLLKYCLNTEQRAIKHFFSLTKIIVELGK